jgi:predicted  nucleic acid-binding Zn ribbon protein
MYVAKIEFRCSDSIDSGLLYGHVMKLLGALRQNGQICGREYPLAITPDGDGDGYDSGRRCAR